MADRATLVSTMKPRSVDIALSAGCVLSSAISAPSGRRIMAKGHVLKGLDVESLTIQGMTSVWVAGIEPGEIAESEAAVAIAGAIACGAYAIETTPSFRVDLVATENCCLLADDALLHDANCAPGIVIASRFNFSFVTRGQRIAAVKTAPFAIDRADFDDLMTMLRARGPVMQARPLAATATVAVVYCDPFDDGAHAREIFEPILRKKLDGYGVLYRNIEALCAPENEDDISRAIERLLESPPTLVLVASATAPAGPGDAVGLAMARVGCQPERFLAPVEPGWLLLVGYKGDVPILSAPGCLRSLKPNVLDLLLPPLLARYRISAWEIAGLGHGGLLE
jgi:molybdenum cofactor cytidylyltransferase